MLILILYMGRNRTAQRNNTTGRSGDVGGAFRKYASLNAPEVVRVSLNLPVGQVCPTVSNRGEWEGEGFLPTMIHVTTAQAEGKVELRATSQNRGRSRRSLALMEHTMSP